MLISIAITKGLHILYLSNLSFSFDSILSSSFEGFDIKNLFFFSVAATTKQLPKFLFTTAMLFFDGSLLPLKGLTMGRFLFSNKEFALEVRKDVLSSETKEEEEEVAGNGFDLEDGTIDGVEVKVGSDDDDDDDEDEDEEDDDEEKEEEGAPLTSEGKGTDLYGNFFEGSRATGFADS